MKEDKFSIRQKGGVVAEVYDGRKWPVVRCGSVYVTATDTTHRVTQSVLCTPSVQEKKRKASKYTLAVGTTHGHVQAFVKDSECLLPVYQRCQAEEKCLILIKKPKDASKKMLKAQSLQNLSVSDTHLYRQPGQGDSSSRHAHSLTAHLMKAAGKTNNMTAAVGTESYTSEPRVRRGNQPLTSNTNGNASVSKGNNSFVPIPELGIFTPDQHVLQNGTYAQHCHNRDINRNKIDPNKNDTVHRYNKNGHNSNSSRNITSDNESRHNFDGVRNPADQNFSPGHKRTLTENSISSSNMNSDFAGYAGTSSSVSGNSSFEESVKSDGYFNSNGSSSMMKRLDFHPIRFQQQQQMMQQSGVYHSCIDISAPQHDFNTLSSTNSDMYSVQSASGFNTMRSDTSDNIINSYNARIDPDTLGSDQTYQHGYRSARDTVTDSKAVSPPVNKMDPSSRSHSLGDLTSGLTISLVGQKKPDSLMDVSEMNSDKHRPTRKGNERNGKSGSKSHNPTSSWNKSEKRNKTYAGDKSTNQHKNPNNEMEEKDFDEVDGGFSEQHHPPHPPTSSKTNGGGGSALQHIRERLQKAVLNSQKIFHPNSSSSPQSSSSSAKEGKSFFGYSANNKAGSAGNPQSGNTVDTRKSSSVDKHTSFPDSRDQNHKSYHTTELYNQQHKYPGHHNVNGQIVPNAYPSQHAGPMQRQHSAPCSSTALSLAPTSEGFEDQSSFKSQHNYQNTLSDPNLYNSPPPPQSSSSSSSSSHHPSLQSYKNLPHNMTSSTEVTHSTKPVPNNQMSSSYSSSYSTHPPQIERDLSPTKSKRALPDVPLSETSERIKRFTEIMKSRMSNHSSACSSRNGGHSADGSSGSQNTPPRISSVETTGSGQDSRKSSVELAKMADVETILQSLAPNQGSSKPPNNHREPLKGSLTDRPGDCCQFGDASGYKYSNIYQREENPSARFSPVAIDREERKSDSKHPAGHDTATPRASAGYRGRYGDKGGVSGQSYPSDDLLLTPGDHSSDSAHTSGTSTSYNGSTLDSGYTTNNDGDHDTYNSNNNQLHTHSQQQSFHPPPHHHHHQHYHQQQKQHPQVFDKQQQQQQHRQNQQENQPQRKGQNPPSLPDKKRAPPPPPPPKRKSSNLVNAHRFGSVQNISTAQAHGNPNDQIWPPTGSHHGLPLNNSSGSSHYPSDTLCNTGYKGHDTQPLHNTSKDSSGADRNSVMQMSKNKQLEDGDRFIHPYYNTPENNKPTTRRSWDYADRYDNRNFENGLQKSHKSENRYKSSDVLYTSRQTSGNHMTSVYPQNAPLNSQRPHPISNQTISERVPMLTTSDPIRHQQQQQHLTQSHQQHHHQYPPQPQNPPLPPPPPPHHHPPPPHPPPPAVTGVSYERESNSNSNQIQSKPSHWGGKDQHRPPQEEQSHSNPSSTSSWGQEGGVKQRPVPISRSNRHARGKTLPGGFRYNEADPLFGQASQFNFELSLYHLTQRYDLSPLCLDLPKNLTLKDMMTFNEVTVEISLNETLGIPSSPQGKTQQIGSPGSAFTPVRHDTQVQGQPVILKVKVISFHEVWEEVQKYCQLGRVLDGDLLVEVNGWFCLGADVPYLKRIVENCQGAITLTVARQKEKDEIRFKGQTPVERIKGLEQQICRLDDLIQLRDEKIKELQQSSTTASPSSSTMAGEVPTGSTAAGVNLAKKGLSCVNGDIPREGMRIGDDEFVV